MTMHLPSGLDRILVLSNRYYPHFKGGYGLSCKAIVDQLIKRGYDVQVLTSNLQAPKIREGNIYRLLRMRDSISKNPFRRRWQHLRWAWISRLNYRIAHRVMRELAPDLVYVWNMGYISLSPLAAAQNLKLPLVFDLGDYWLLQRCQELCLEPDRRKRAYRLFIQGIESFNPFQFPNIIANSEALKRGYVEAGFPAEHITVIPRGLPADLIRDTALPLAQRSAVELFYAGRLSEEKGVHLAIEAVALLNQDLAPDVKRSVHLDIVGDGDPSYVHRLHELVESLGLRQVVHFAGRLARQELIERYKRYDAVLIPSIWVEPFGRVTIEAMAQGACVIASDRGGVAEIITHGQDGLLVEPENSAAIAQAVVDLLRDRDLGDRIRRAAIATVRERYSLDKVGEQVETYLNAALAGHHRNQERQSKCAS